jgi:hypothetical protein
MPLASFNQVHYSGEFEKCVGGLGGLGGLHDYKRLRPDCFGGLARILAVLLGGLGGLDIKRPKAKNNLYEQGDRGDQFTENTRVSETTR